MQHNRAHQYLLYSNMVHEQQYTAQSTAAKHSNRIHQQSTAPEYSSSSSRSHPQSTAEPSGRNQQRYISTVQQHSTAAEDSSRVQQQRTAAEHSSRVQPQSLAAEYGSKEQQSSGVGSRTLEYAESSTAAEHSRAVE